MEVLGAVSAVLTIFEASNKTYKFIRSIPEIQNDWQDLRGEIAGVKQMLEIINSSPYIITPGSPVAPLVVLATDKLERTFYELERLSDKAICPIDDLKSEQTEPKASKKKWLYYHSEIQKIRGQVQKAEKGLYTVLNLSLQVSQGYQSTVTNQRLEAIEARMISLAIDSSTGSDIIQQLQHSFDAFQIKNNDHSRQVEDVSSSLDSETLEDRSTAVISQSAMLEHRFPGACPRPCFCRCHKRGMIFRAPCDYSKCRSNIASRKASWRLYLSYWLSGYGISVSISASLRPQRVIPANDVRLIITASLHPVRETAERHFHGLHPLDEYDGGFDVMERALHYDNFVVLEILLSLWDDYLRQHGIERANFFLAQSMLRQQRSEEEQYLLRKLISYSDEDATCGSTALHRAIEDESIDGVREALEKEPSLVDVLDLEGRAPMHLAVGMNINPRPILFELQKAGADINQRDAHGWTPLMVAASFGKLDAAKWILEQDGKSHRHQNKAGNSALHLVLRSSAPLSADLTEMLLKAGANPSSRNRTGETPLHRLQYCEAEYSTCNRKIQLMKKANADIDAETNDQMTLLLVAMAQNNSNAIRASVDMGASLSGTDEFGYGIFHLAAFYCDSQTIEELVMHKTLCCAGIDPFAIDKNGDSPWDVFILTLHLPRQAITSLIHTTEERCRAFESFYIQVRDFQFQSEMDILEQISTLLRQGEKEKASSELLVLAQQKEPRKVWATGVTMQPLRSIHLQIGHGDVSGALDAIEEQVDILSDEMWKSPWEYDSRWWHFRPYHEGASEEDWQRQAEFAVQMRKEGLERWDEFIGSNYSSGDPDDDSECETTDEDYESEEA